MREGAEHPRWIVKRVFVVLSLGVATTVLVAWATQYGFSRSILLARARPDSVFIGSDTTGSVGRSLRRDAYFIVRDPEGFAWFRTSSLRNLGLPTIVPPDWIELPKPVGTELATESEIVASGLPFRAFYRAQHSFLSVTDDFNLALPAATRRYSVGAWDLRPHANAYKPGFVVPFMPIWGGLAADIACYALIWSVPLLAAPAARRAVRHRSGRCPRCAYDLHSCPGAGCPECGRDRGDPRRAIGNDR